MSSTKTKETVGTVRHRGSVRFYDESRGWGFIKPDEPLNANGRDMFVHRSALEESGLSALTPGQRISFTIGQHQGRMLAKELILEGK